MKGERTWSIRNSTWEQSGWNLWNLEANFDPSQYEASLNIFKPRLLCSIRDIYLRRCIRSDRTRLQLSTCVDKCRVRSDVISTQIRLVCYNAKLSVEASQFFHHSEESIFLLRVCSPSSTRWRKSHMVCPQIKIIAYNPRAFYSKLFSVFFTDSFLYYNNW